MVTTVRLANLRFVAFRHYIAFLCCAVSLASWFWSDHAEGQSATSIRLESCGAEHDPSDGRVTLSARIAAETIGLGVNQVRTTFDVFRGTSNSIGVFVDRFEHTQLGVSPNQSWIVPYTLVLGGGEYYVECSLAHNGGNVVASGGGWVTVETTQAVEFIVTSKPVGCPEGSPFVNCGVKISNTRAEINQQVDVILSATASHSAREMMVNLVLKQPDDWRVTDVGSANCASAVCSWNSQLSASATRDMRVTFEPSQTGSSLFEGTIEWQYVDGSSGGAISVVSTSPVRVTAGAPEPPPPPLTPTTTPLLPCTLSPSVLCEEFVQTFWLHMIVGIIATAILSAIGWGTRHLHVGRCFR